MIESYLEKGCCRGVRGNMPPDPLGFPVRPDHHGHGIPPDDAFYFPFQFLTPRIGLFVRCGDRIDIWRIPGTTVMDPLAGGAVIEQTQDFLYTARRTVADQVIERIQPFPVFKLFYFLVLFCHIH